MVSMVAVTKQPDCVPDFVFSMVSMVAVVEQLLSIAISIVGGNDGCSLATNEYYILFCIFAYFCEWICYHFVHNNHLGNTFVIMQEHEVWCSAFAPNDVGNVVLFQ